MRRIGRSCEDSLNDVSRYIGQTKIAATVAERELFMIEAEEVEDGGVEIMGVDWVFSNRVCDFIGRAINHAAFDSATCKPG